MRSERREESRSCPGRALRGLASGRVADASDRVAFASSDVILGEFRCPAWHPDFSVAGPINHHVVVFPREAVWIEREDVPRFVADPAVATIYNPRQPYRRSAISARGDRADWLGVSDRLAREVIRAFSPGDAEREDVFRHPRAVVGNDVYVAQRQLFGRLASPDVDPLEVEERALAIMGDVMRSAYGASSGTGEVRVRDVVENAKAVIMSRLFENLPVGELADLAGVSAFHLCRTFRASTGMTLHGYRRDMRLRTMLGVTAAHRGSLSALALDGGFSSHSHFTTAFRRAFGRPPSLADAGLSS